MRKLATALLVFALSAAAETPSAIAIRDAKIVPVSGPTISNGTVVLRNGLIEAVGADVQPPADAWVIDGKGLTVYPGLIDALSTVGIPQPAPAARAGAGRTAAPADPFAAMMAAAAAGPQIRGPEDRPQTTSWVVAVDQVSASDARIATFRNAGFTTTVTFPTQGIFAGQGSVLDLAGEKPGQMAVAPAVGQYIGMRTSGGFGSFPGALFGVIAYVRQIYLDADHYKMAKDAYAKNPRGAARPEYDRALEGVIASQRILLPASRAVEIARMQKFAAELKQPAILYGGHEAFKVADKIQLPMLVSAKWPEKARDADPDEVDSLRTLEMRDKAPSTPAALARARVKFAFYSDGIDRPADVIANVKKAIDAGLGADQALRAMTLSAAELYGVDDRLGSIEKGKIANLVVTKGDLFGDKPQVQMIFVDGQKFEPTPEETPQTPGAGMRRPTGGVE